MTGDASKLKYINARLLAIQAAYAHALSGAPWEKILARAASGRLGGSVIDDASGAMRVVALEAADKALFASLTDEIRNRADDLAGILRSALDDKFEVKRLDVLLKTLLTTGIAEFYANPRLDRAIVVNEYTDIARSFYDGSEVKLVNAVLDKVGRLLKND
ncbi:MAG: transcription antitermination factor NusB [Alphaproteobacteria bacterium]|nr:transcription antitermination factor NusB [Alphaproteobacteria bacterium]